MEPILRIQGISKTFPGVKALDNISLDILKGEIHGLVGENGAGKSTLMHILAGVFPPDSGKIVLEGKELSLTDEKKAQEAGIQMVFQERSLVGELSVAENIFAGRQPVRLLNFIDSAKMQRDAKELLRLLSLDVSPLARISQLNSIQQQLVEIAKALSMNPKILILDEPTATITARETETLFSLIRRLKERGVSIIYISHRLKELPSICDRVSVLKDGVYQGTRMMNATSLETLVTMMVGRKILDIYDDRGGGNDETILEVKNLTSTKFRNINFSLRRKEILGFSGLSGAGRTELALALFGCDPHVKGEIRIKGKSVAIDSPDKAILQGIGYLSEDRKDSGLFLDLDVASNMSASNLDLFTRFGILNDAEIRNAARQFVERLKISTPSLSQRALNLSGGNQQKLLMGRWLMRNPTILIADEPTRGVDVGAKSDIYHLIRDIARNGTSVIVISSELQEILNLCDRIVVMHQGAKTGELTHDEASEERLMQLSAGLGVQG